MDRETTRRAVLAALLGGGVVGTTASPAGDLLGRFAPLSGSVWDTAGRNLPDEVQSQYGTATLRYDDDGVPHIEADSEQALSFAVGYAQGADRLFQMDLQRRQMRGELSAVVGDVTLASDRFHVKMDFAGAAEATWRQYQDTETGALVRAYTDGINRHLANDRPLPMEYDLLGFEPDPWRPADAFLAEKQIGWNLTGRFRTLRQQTVAAALGSEVAQRLYPDLMDHDAAILSRARGGGDQPDTGAANSTTSPASNHGSGPPRRDLLDWVSRFESPRGTGSNSWVVSGSETDSGSPILANDPHLSLMAPPTWYEMNLTGPETNVRGVTFPGAPFVVIGQNDTAAWGFTNTGVDVIDFYEYETRDGEYRYGDEWRAFDTEERTIAVDGGDDRTVTVRKTVHGPMLSREDDGDELEQAVGVAWTGFGATRTTEGVIRLNRSDGFEDVLEAIRLFDLPTQNFVYADTDGNTHYRVLGRVPIRRTDGEQVPGDRVFDGSAREGEWAGYTPYGETDWDGDGFIPFAEMPHVDQPAYLGTANQRILTDLEDYPYYFEKPYAAPFRGLRLWERLDRRVASADPVTGEFMRDLQRDAYDKRAELFVPTMLDARPAVADRSERAATLLDALEGWDFRMVRGSRAALVFHRFMKHYRTVVYEPRLREGLGERRDVTEYYGSDWVLITLDPDSAWFPEGRDAAIAQALSQAADEIARADWETYGDYNQTAIDHPFDRDWLNYPRYPTDGSSDTLNNFSKERGHGSSWRQVCPMDADSDARNNFPGGNDGSPFSEHYADQLEAWANGEYKPNTLAIEGTVAVEFRGDDG
jgi:penicillin amidase